MDNKISGEEELKDKKITKEEFCEMNIKKMNKEELKVLAEALINENTELEKQSKNLTTENETLSKTAKKAAELSCMYTSISKDFEQYRKRNAEIEQSSKDNAIIELGLKLIPVYDNFKLAIDSIDDDKYKEGVNLIFRQFTETLKSFGICDFKADGEVFDPTRHNALMVEETNDEKLKGTIKVSYSDGYMYKDKIIKQSQVIVYK